MSLTLWIAAGISATLLVLLFAPIRIVIEASGRPRPDRAEIRLWGWRVRAWTAGAGGPEPPPKAGRMRRPRTGSRLDLRRFAPIGRLLAGAPGRRLLYRSVKALHPEGRLHLRAGFDDPALTGVLAGPVYALQDRLARLGVFVAPDFEGAALASDGRLRVRTRLAALAWPALRFAFEPGAARALWTLAAGPAAPRRRAQTQAPR